MSRLRIAIIAVAVFAALAVSALLFVRYSIKRAFRLTMTPQQLEDAKIAFKGALGEAILAEHGASIEIESSEGKTGLDALLAPPPGGAGKGLIAEYQQNPEKFRQYADMLDTALHSRKLGDIMFSQARGEHVPATSEGLAVERNLKLDAWGRPFCILRIDERLAVVSGGPTRVPCKALPLTTVQLAASKRNTYAGPSNVVVVIVSRKQPGQAPTL